MTYCVSVTAVPNADLIAAQIEAASIPVGNLMSERAQHAMRDRGAQDVYKKYPDAAYCVTALKFLLPGPRETDWRKRLSGWQDGYDDLRLSGGVYRLTDPVDNIPAAYRFAENGRLLFMGHFDADAPVNNDNGYQGVFFDEQGNVTQFAVVDKKDALHMYAVDGELPTAVAPLRRTVTALKAQNCCDLIASLASLVDDETAQQLRNTQQRHFKAKPTV